MWVGGEQVVADHESTKVDRMKVQADAGTAASMMS